VFPKETGGGNKKKKETPVQDNKTTQTDANGFQPARTKQSQQPQQFQNSEGFQTRGGRSGRGRGGRNFGGREGENQAQDQNQYQGGRGGEGRRGGRGPRRGRGGGRFGNRNTEEQPRFTENQNREFNQRGEDLTGEKKTRKRQPYGDKKSGGFVKEFSNNNVGTNFPKVEQEAPAEWTSTAPDLLDASAEGWGDNAPAETTTDANAQWDAINQETNQNVPKAPPVSQKKPTEPPTKTLDDFRMEQEQNKEKLDALFKKNSVIAPVPRTIEKDESGRYFDYQKQPTSNKKKDDPKAKVKTTKPTPQQQHLESLIFKFEPHRRFNQDDNPPKDQPNAGGEIVNRGSRKGRGGQGRGNAGRTGGNAVNASSTLPKPDEWPDLV